MPALHGRFHFQAQSLTLEVVVLRKEKLRKRSLRQILRSVQGSALLSLRLPITFLVFIQTNQAYSFVKIKPITKKIIVCRFGVVDLIVRRM